MPSILALCVAAPVWAGPADGVVELEVLPGWRTDTGTHMAGLRLTLAQGWKTYWRVPGDGGIPPRFAWTGSDNLNGVALHWPTPEISHINHMRSIGYEGVVVIPIELSLPDANAPARLAGQMQIGVCEEICVPVLLNFDAMLPLDGARDSAIVASLIDQPRAATTAGLQSATCTIVPSERGLQVTASLRMPAFGPVEDVVIETGDQQVWVSEPDTMRQGDMLTATSDMVHVEGGAFALNRSDMRITIFAGGQAVYVQGCNAG